jgi:Ser/Thr protein kinase RdoA (MazF antagonist)
MTVAHKKVGHKKYRRTRLRKGYQHLRELTPTELAGWFDAIDRAERSLRLRS